MLKGVFSRISVVQNQAQLLGLNPLRTFAVKRFEPKPSYRQEKRALRKYGMKLHFYDSIPVVQRQLPKDQFRAGLSAADLAPYPNEVKQAFSLNNASIGEIQNARYRQIRNIFGKHELDSGN